MRVILYPQTNRVSCCSSGVMICDVFNNRYDLMKHPWEQATEESKGKRHGQFNQGLLEVSESYNANMSTGIEKV